MLLPWFIVLLTIHLTEGSVDPVKHRINVAILERALAAVQNTGKSDHLGFSDDRQLCEEI